MATTSAKYFYCSGTTLDNVLVTMTDGSCIIDSEYNDTYCSYRTYKKTITFNLSKALPTSLSVRFQYLYSYFNDTSMTPVYTSYITETVVIPAGVTNKSISHTCREERWCDSSGGSTPLVRTVV